jgi:hypothetical protein
VVAPASRIANLRQPPIRRTPAHAYSCDVRPVFTIESEASSAALLCWQRTARDSDTPTGRPPPAPPHASGTSGARNIDAQDAHAPAHAALAASSSSVSKLVYENIDLTQPANLNPHETGRPSKACETACCQGNQSSGKVNTTDTSRRCSNAGAIGECAARTRQRAFVAARAFQATTEVQDPWLQWCCNTVALAGRRSSA